MRTNRSRKSHEELLRECAELCARLTKRPPKRRPSWRYEVNWQLLAGNTSRRLWTARDLFRSEPSRGSAAALSRLLKRRRCEHRLVRGLVDARTGAVSRQCTVWWIEPMLRKVFKSDRDWRFQYHLQLALDLAKSGRLTPELDRIITEKINADLLRDDPDADMTRVRQFDRQARPGRHTNA